MENSFKMPWVEMIKPEVVNIGEGAIELTQNPEALHINHNGDMHAAVLFSVLEMAGMGAMTLLLGDKIKNSLVVLKDMHIHYDARAQGKITFKAKLNQPLKEKLIAAVDAGEAIEEVITAYAYDENGKQVSHATMTGVIKPKH